MLKRIISGLMASILLCGAAPAAFAADSQAESEMQKELERVTVSVKSKLGISNDYTNFTGEWYGRNNAGYWELNWNDDEYNSISVRAGKDGKIFAYEKDAARENESPYTTQAPSFPKLSQNECQKIAEDFLKKVLVSAEGYRFDKANNQISLESQNIIADLLVNGLETPVCLRLRLDLENGEVSSFRRDDITYNLINAYPSARPTVSLADAREKLSGTYQLLPVYAAVTDAEDGKPKKAELQYINYSDQNQYIDAHTGKIVIPAQIYAALSNGDKEAGAGAREEAADKGLSDAEQEGIEKLSDVLDTKKLDEILRQMPELGLGGLELVSSNYSYNKETQQYLAHIDYTKETPDEIFWKSAMLDAKTGELLNFYATSYRDDGEKKKDTLTKQQAEEKASAFLQKYQAADFAKTELFPERMTELGDTLYFAEKVNGYFYPENYFTISINLQDGTIKNYNKTFEETEFGSAEGILSEEEAMEHFRKLFQTKLKYAVIPISWEENKAMLVYVNETEKYTYGVDAKTGEALHFDYSQMVTEPSAYTDITDDKEILALAEYGIGFPDKEFQKAKPLSEFAMLQLLLSAFQNWYAPYTQEDIDRAYQDAYSLQILPKGQRQEDRQITRIEYMKALLDASGYKSAANLKNIYKIGYSDAADIPEQYQGYAALAQGMGLAKGDGQGRLLPNAVITREQAAIILYHFMNRER